MSQASAPPGETISDTFIDAVCERLAQNKQVQRTLPGGGRLHIDRPVPFLCIYRQPPRRPDNGTDRLVMGEAAHLIAPAGSHLKPGPARLVQRIAGTLAEKFGAFLIIELWTAAEPFADAQNGNLPPTPAFRILSSTNRPPTVAIEALAKSLRRIKLLKQPARVEVVYNKRRSPAGLPMLVPSNTARQLRCFVVGLEIAPMFRQPDTGELYPVLFRNLHRRLAGALKRAAFEFVRTQTNYTLPSHRALGRRAVVRAVWDVDRQLADISNSFDFLLQVTPVNINPAWADFKRRNFENTPVLYYRPMPNDPATLKGRLYRVPLDRVEDPTLSLLFRQKRTELDRQLTMLSDRGNRNFLYGSLQLFGGVSRELRRLAEQLLEAISPRSREQAGGKRLKARDFARQAQAELDYYRQRYPELSATVQIREDTVGLMVSNGNLLIGKETKIAPSRVQALLQHEVGTHVLTYFNGRAQPFQQLYTGLAGYEELQEGLAVLAEYLVGGLSRPRLRLLAGRVIAAACLIDDASFVETFRVLHKQYGFKQKTAFTITVRVYRGGGLTKDAVYLRGLVEVLNYLHEGGRLEPLFVGKIAANHIPIIRELQSRQVLHAIPLRPRYMDDPQTDIKIARLRGGVSVLNLLDDLLERKKQ